MARPRRIPQVLLLIETSRAYGRGLVEGIARYAAENGPWSIFFEERGLTDPLPRWFKDWRGQGIISRITHKADLERLLAKGLPIVEMYADPKLGLPRVFPNEETLCRLAVEHFLDRGLGQFAFFCTKDAHWSMERRRVFEQAVVQRGFECHSFHLERPRQPAGKNNPRLVEERDVIRWLRALPKPCGILCASDFYAIRLLQACRDCGIVAPEHVAILGADNDPVFCGVSHPQLSSIDLGVARIGYEAAALLARMMAGKPCPEGGVRVEPLQVVTRESTDILALNDADIVRAVRLIREQACQRLRVSEVAESVGLSRRVFEQRFQLALHRSPKDEILRIRMERAKMLLVTSNLSVALVAKKCGFASQEYFARAFHRRTGATPGDFRKARRQPAAGSLLS